MQNCYVHGKMFSIKLKLELDVFSKSWSVIFVIAKNDSLKIIVRFRAPTVLLGRKSSVLLLLIIVCRLLKQSLISPNQ